MVKKASKTAVATKAWRSIKDPARAGTITHNEVDSAVRNLLTLRVLPDFQPGDTVRVHVRIKESRTTAERLQLQVFEGVVIACKRGGSRETITVRQTSFGIGIEVIFPLDATAVDHIDLVKRGRVRRAKLYYLRELRGKAARIRERITRTETTETQKATASNKTK
jgi:large subunit ribosomal protein L19